VFRELRFKQEELRPLLNNPSSKEFSETVEGIATAATTAIENARRRGPLMEANLRIQFAVGQLVGDTIAAMEKLPLSEPRDIRDAITLLAALEGNANEKTLEACIDYLAETEFLTVSELQERFLELFPVVKKGE
jgi:hypothetical protein